MACELEVSLSVVQRLMKQGTVRRHSSSTRPSLTAENQVERVKFAVEHVRFRGNDCSFHDMYDVVHIDEKWFNEDSDRKTYYLLDNEEEPHRARKSKRFIGKTMFIAAVARPRYISLLSDCLIKFYNLSILIPDMTQVEKQGLMAK
jgi:hypothetical protein